MQLFLVPFSLVPFRCSRRSVSRCKHCSTVAERQVPACFIAITLQYRGIIYLPSSFISHKSIISVDLDQGIRGIFNRERVENVSLESRQNISQAHACLDFNSTQSFSSGSLVKNLPAMHQTQVQSLGRDDPLKEGVATHFSIRVRKIPWTEEPVRLQSMGSQSQTQLK